MRSHRFYTDIELSENTLVNLPSQAAHHCGQVLRYKVGDNLTVFNGDGFDYYATIDRLEKKSCQIKIEKKIDPQNESPLKIHLYQGIARGDKMDLIIQKAVELGVTAITPIFTERCNVKLEGKRLDKKIQHWQQIQLSACEQSGRAIIPAFNTATHLHQTPQQSASSFYLEPTSNQGFGDLPEQSLMSLFIGPEGGFAEKEINFLEKIGCQGLKMGPRILRTETAGLSAIAILQSHFGDI